ncbi:uncharacterized protein LOC115260687 [Aedes albopictus]|uniref:DUF4706 domain-containing protein n=1 Tax=Aedes albopictus TaxID=7160 RepID=A0ABM1ZKS0_AEDAL|nr:uncharacterized protein LOC109432375 [Aedes albopictus]XP_029717737.1 uncharacterized protein LOC115260687 [Aedes albopictus]KXJ70389.1 hypothetical protein RP20_CCG023847 [Aedes albopictus]
MESKLKDHKFVADYFANLNDVSRKISLDIDEIRSTYEHIWDDLSRDEQIEIINETLIKPELTLKYFDNFSTSSDSFRNIIESDENSDDRKVNLYDGKTLQTFQYLKTGRKVIHDESFGLFRDEHSAPFAHKTKSQINLSIFPPEKDKPSGRRLDLAKKLEKIKSPKTNDSSSSAKSHSKVSNGEPPTRDNENNLIQGIKSNGPNNDFLANFICTQASASAALAAASMASDEMDGQSLENIGFDDDKINLFRNSSRSDSLHQAQSSSVEEDDKNFDEMNSLLGNSKGFDFLNNW